MAVGKRKPEGKDADPKGTERALRDEAKERLAHVPESTGNLNGQTPDQLIHELRVHQIELETQAEELRRAQRALEESYDKYVDLYDFAPLGYVTLTDKGLIAEANLTAAILLGTERNLLKITRFSKFVAENDADAWYRYFMTVLKQEEKQSCTLMLKRVDGFTFPARLESIRLPGTSNGPPTVRVAVSDISDIRQVEKSVRVLSRIADEAPVSVTVHDFEGNFLYANEATFRLHGFPREEFMKKNLHEIDVPESELLIAQRMEQIREKGEADFEVQHYRKDGSTFPLHVNGKVIDWGGTWSLLSIATDLSERQRADRSLKESEDRFRKIFENSPIGMVLVSPEFRFVSVNPVWIAMTGYSEQELLKMSFPDITHPDHLTGDMEHIRELMAGTIPVYQTEKRYIRKDGSILWGLIRVTVIKDPQGNLRNFAAQIEDITERKAAEETLRESEGVLADIIEKNPLSIQIVDAAGFTLSVNPAHTLLFGSVPPPDFSIFADLLQKQPALENLILRARSGEVVHLPDLYFNPRDTYPEYPDMPVWVRAIIFPLTGRDGKPERFVFMHENITERKAAEDALKKVHVLLNETQEISQFGGWEYDIATGRITWTDEVYRIHGVSRDFDPGGLNRDIQFYTHKDIPVISEAFRRCCEQGEPYDLELELMRADGRQIWVRTMGKPDLQDGRIVRVHGNIIDITERRQAEDALRQKNEELDNRNRLISTLLDTAPIGIFMVEAPSGRPVIANTAATRLLGRGILPDVTETNLAEVYEAYRTGTSERYPTPEMPVVRGMQGASSHIDDMEVVRPDGTRTLLEIFGNPVLDSRNQIVASLVCFLDITDRKHAEAQREILIRELAQKNTELDRFTYTVSHDLKSPLLTISAFLVLLEKDLKDAKPEQVTHDILRVTESAEKMEQLLTTLLTLSRSGKCVDYPLPVPLIDLSREAERLLEATLQQRGVRLVISENLPVVMGDRHRLLQVMTNLLDNAVKFMGDQKEPVIAVSLRPDAKSPVICLQDNGMGIKNENLGKVFGLYERFNPEIPGTGIGLATVKRIIEAHGGNIWVESEGEGKGTTVCFTLPSGTSAKE